MNTIEMSEILNLYRKCGINDISYDKVIRSTLNSGTLNNKLSIGNTLRNDITNNSVWTNNTITENNVWFLLYVQLWKTRLILCKSGLFYFN